MSSPKRPLSPHLQIYRWQWTMIYSILHRTTGIVVSLGFVFGHVAFGAGFWCDILPLIGSLLGNFSCLDGVGRFFIILAMVFATLYGIVAVVGICEYVNIVNTVYFRAYHTGSLIGHYFFLFFEVQLNNCIGGH